MKTGNWLRKAGVTVHVTASLGWLGAVAAFFAVAVLGSRSDDRQTVCAAYLAMDWIAWLVILPLCAASLVTGVVQALATPWGLLRHYWVVLKLALTVLATLVLLLHMRVIDDAARAALQPPFDASFGKARLQLVADSAAALVVLVVTTVLGVYKPQGMIRGPREGARTGQGTRRGPGPRHLNRIAVPHTFVGWLPPSPCSKPMSITRSACIFPARSISSLSASSSLPILPAPRSCRGRRTCGP